MNKNDTFTKKIAKGAPKPVKQIAPPEREKTSIYIDSKLWVDFRSITAYPRGRTSEILENFIKEYVKLNAKR